MNTGAVRSVGIGLADETNGPFSLDVRGITAINMRKQVTNLDV